jgi:hypothetical protein
VSLLDIDMLQTPHGKQEAVAPTVSTVRQSYADKPVLPVIDGEASYEMLGNNIPTEWTRQMFWLCMMNGTAGHTYGANGIWQCNRRGQPHGPSPTAGSPPTGYGTISWDEAMNLPGSRQVGLGKKLFEQFAWQDFEPHPEWASFVARPALSLEGCQWIWFPEGNPAQDAPAARRFFRKTFVLPEGKVIKSAQLRMSADDRFSARLNGHALGSSRTGIIEGWKTPRQFDDIAPQLKPGANVLAVEAENLPSPGQNPAGLIARLQIQFADGKPMDVISDDTWRAAKTESAGWDGAEFDDATWAKAMAVARYGQGPWGNLDSPAGDALHGPQSTGIPDIIRVIYVPRAEGIAVHQLKRSAQYSAAVFDPVTGQSNTLPHGEPEQDGDWIFPPPPGIDHDWVLILQIHATGSDRK